jgi:hypothetical protein
MLITHYSNDVYMIHPLYLFIIYNYSTIFFTVTRQQRVIQLGSNNKLVLCTNKLMIFRNGFCIYNCHLLGFLGNTRDRKGHYHGCAGSLTVQML